MTLLRPGDNGTLVVELQCSLAKLGYAVGTPDGVYGPKTKAAVLEFQLDYTDIDDDGVAGPQTLARINQAIEARPQPSKPAPIKNVPCNAETWSAFEKLVDLVTQYPVKYGPGRGLWVNDRFVITYGPGSLNSKNWKNFLGKPYPSFHCTSWTNFFLGWLLRRNDQYTHAGNIPDLFDLLSEDASMHPNPGAGPYRGYGDVCSLITPDGSGAKRSGVSGVVDARELYARRGTLPTFIVCGQSTRTHGKWKWWHHTVLFVTHGGRLYRIAADGHRDAVKGYSAQPMRWVEVTDKNVGSLDGAVYKAYGVGNENGAYGNQAKPIASVTVES